MKCTLAWQLFKLSRVRNAHIVLLLALLYICTICMQSGVNGMQY